MDRGITMKPFLIGILLASGLGLAQGASALTLDTRTPLNPDGSAKFADPDQQVENLASPPAKGSAPGTKTFQSGNSTFSFGVTRGDARPGFGRLSPFNRFGVDRGVRGSDRDQ
jgi:hypothetical protein